MTARERRRVAANVQAPKGASERRADRWTGIARSTIRSERGLPDVVIADNGSEVTSRAFDAGAYARGIKIEYTQPGKPV